MKEKERRKEEGLTVTRPVLGRENGSRKEERRDRDGTDGRIFAAGVIAIRDRKKLVLWWKESLRRHVQQELAPEQRIKKKIHPFVKAKASNLAHFYLVDWRGGRKRKRPGGRQAVTSAKSCNW